MNKNRINTETFGTEHQLLRAWELFEGKIDCGYTRKLWGPNELKVLSKQVSDRLQNAGCQKGDMVALLLTNTVAFPVILMALLNLDCNPLLLSAASVKTEFERITQKLPVKYYIHDYIEGISSFPKNDKTPLILNEEGLKVRISNTLHSISEDLGMYGVLLQPTSGTYGESGICIRNQEVTLSEAENYVSTIDFYDKIRVLITTPLSHAYGFGFGLVSSIITHSELVLNHSFNPKKVLRTLTNKPCDILTIVPPMARVLIMLKESYPEFGMAKYVFTSGSKCDAALAKRFEDAFGVDLYTNYGSTETGAISTSYTPEMKLPGVGKAMKNVSIQIENKEKYREFNEEIGEVHVKSSSMMLGYIGNDANRLKQPVSFNTGDIGSITEGNLNLTGRIKDIINVDGLKVDSKEIESIISAFPGICDAAVYPGNDEYGNKIILCAFSEDGAPVDKESLRAYCSEHMARHKIPRLFFRLEELPRTASGKCVKIQLPEYKTS